MESPSSRVLASAENRGRRAGARYSRSVVGRSRTRRAAFHAPMWKMPCSPRRVSQFDSEEGRLLSQAGDEDQGQGSEGAGAQGL